MVNNDILSFEDEESIRHFRKFRAKYVCCGYGRWISYLSVQSITPVNPVRLVFAWKHSNV